MKVGDMVMRSRDLVRWNHYDEVGIVTNIYFFGIEVMWQHVISEHTSDTLEVVLVS
jgi:hypothetical protein